MSTYDLIRSFKSAHTLESIHKLCEDICIQYDFEYFNYTVQVPVSLVSPRYISFSNYPSGWREQYKQRHYISTDPLLQYCARNVTPIGWHQVDRYIRNKSDSRVIHEASSHGLNNGISIPVRSFQGEIAMLSFATQKTHPGIEQHIETVTADLLLLSGYVHTAIKQVLAHEDFNVLENDITQREKECLLWITEGKTTNEIAVILGISSSTVTFHIQNTIKKLGAVNRQQAVARVVALGIIAPGFS